MDTSVQENIIDYVYLVRVHYSIELQLNPQCIIKNFLTRLIEHMLSDQIQIATYRGYFCKLVNPFRFTE